MSQNKPQNPYLPRLAIIERITIENENKDLKTFTLKLTDNEERGPFNIYGWYSNKSRGIKRKHGILRPGDAKLPVTLADTDIIDVSEYNPSRIPSKTWRKCIKKIWEIDPLCCPHCGSSLRKN